MVKPTARTIAALVGIVTMTGACVQRVQSGAPSNNAMSDAEIVAAMETEARSRAPGYPNLRLSDVIFDRGHVYACGYFRSPGEVPLAFISMDETPGDGDRLTPVLLAAAGIWNTPQRQELAADSVRRCAAAGIPLPPASPGF